MTDWDAIKKAAERLEPPTPEPTRAASEQFDLRVRELAKELPGITFGYIGNVYFGPYYDDRSWRIFLPHPGWVGERTDNVYIGSTAALDRRIGDWPSIEAEARRLYALKDRSC